MSVFDTLGHFDDVRHTFVNRPKKCYVEKRALEESYWKISVTRFRPHTSGTTLNSPTSSWKRLPADPKLAEGVGHVALELFVTLHCRIPELLDLLHRCIGMSHFLHNLVCRKIEIEHD